MLFQSCNESLAFLNHQRTGSEGGGTHRTWLQSWLNQHELHWRKTGVLLYRKTNSCFLGFHACKFQTHASLLNINLLIGKCFLIKKKKFSTTAQNINQMNLCLLQITYLSWCKGSISLSRQNFPSKEFFGSGTRLPSSILQVAVLKPCWSTRAWCGETSFAGWKEVPGDLTTFLPILRFPKDPSWQQANDTAHLFKKSLYLSCRFHSFE